VTTSPRIALVIPARHRSSRFPGKPLATIAGKSLVRRVWERCIGAVDAADVHVATDDSRIAEHCRSFGANVLMTSESCLTGTDRVAEAAHALDADVIVNVQGDEPLVEPADVRAVVESFLERPGAVACGMCPIDSVEDYESRTVPKVVARPDGLLLYMSRAPIPATKERSFPTSRRQVCIYAFSRAHLDAYASVGRKTPLEEIEDIEILRFLETGVEVRMVELPGGSVAVDVPSDVARVEAILASRGEGA